MQFEKFSGIWELSMFDIFQSCSSAVWMLPSSPPEREITIHLQLVSLRWYNYKPGPNIPFHSCVNSSMTNKYTPTQTMQKKQASFAIAGVPKRTLGQIPNGSRISLRQKKMTSKHQLPKIFSTGDIRDCTGALLHDKNILDQ